MNATIEKPAALDRGVSNTKVLYTGKTHTTGGRDGGSSRASDGQLDVKLSLPGSSRPGTNPEQLFAAGWSACFIGALKAVGAQKKVRVPADVAIDTEIDLRQGEDGYSLGARLNISLPGLPRDVAESLIESAQNTCPYSKATHGNIDVSYNLV